MNRLEVNDRCIPQDYEDWKRVAKLVEDNNIPHFRKYSTLSYATYESWPAFLYSRNEHIVGCSSHPDGMYNTISVEEFLIKAGIIEGKYKYRKNGPIKHIFV